MTSPALSTQNPELDRAKRRVGYFEELYPESIKLAYYAAFPLTITSDLLYCMREEFKINCPWYSVPDILLSGLCNTIGYDLYEMEASTRQVLLLRLKKKYDFEPFKFDRHPFDRLQDFMTAYINYHVFVRQNQRLRVLGDPPAPEWTTLAFLKPGEAFQKIQRELQQLAENGDQKERFRRAALVESYSELPILAEYKPILVDWARKTAEGEPVNDLAATIEAIRSSGFPPLKTLIFEDATIAFEDEDQPDNNPDELRTFNFETVTVNDRGEIVQRETLQAYCFAEPLTELTEEAPPLEMVAIPGGSFEMGSPETELERYEDESPQHTVTVSPFFISKYPITQSQWRAIAQLPQQNRSLEPAPSNFKGNNRPVEQVSWFEAEEFCDRLSRHTGRTYRLPTEAEWEYACRAGTTTPFHFGETITTELANYDGNNSYDQGPEGEYYEQTTDAGSFPANAFGLYDMHGNVLEWCLDDWHDNYEAAPTEGSAWLTSDDKSIRVLRGGSWNYNPWHCRSASRDANPSSESDYRIGLRVVCVAL